MSESNGASTNPVEQLKEKIVKQKALYKSLETDLLTPRLLDSQIESLTEIVAHLPERLDEEIRKAEANLANLRETRDSKLSSKTNQLDQLQHRRDNLKDLYIAADEELQAMNKQLKLIEHSDTLAQLLELRRKSKELAATLPENLRGIESKEDLKALEDMIDES